MRNKPSQLARHKFLWYFFIILLMFFCSQSDAYSDASELNYMARQLVFIKEQNKMAARDLQRLKLRNKHLSETVKVTDVDAGYIAQSELEVAKAHV